MMKYIILTNSLFCLDTCSSTNGLKSIWRLLGKLSLSNGSTMISKFAFKDFNLTKTKDKKGQLLQKPSL